MMAAIQLYDREIIGLPDVRGYARQSGITKRTDIEIDDDDPVEMLNNDALEIDIDNI